MESNDRGYRFKSSKSPHSHAYLWPPVEAILSASASGEQRIFELGCGNGAFAERMAGLGWKVTGIDPSLDGIEIAKRRSLAKDGNPTFAVGSAYDPLASQFGQFPFVISLEVVEHVYFPRKLAASVAELLLPGGTAIISTPYHGYLKNLALAITGKMDSHFTALWDHGHIKFWSPRTLETLFAEQGLSLQSVMRVGRVPSLAKSMICVFSKPK